MDNENKCRNTILICHTNLYYGEYTTIRCILPKEHSHSHLGFDGYDIYRWQ